MTPRNPAHAATPGALALISLALLAVAGCGGKGAAGSCADGRTCGGTPNGVWDSAALCQFEVDRADQTLNPNEQVITPLVPTLTSSQAQPTTAGDWCSQLIYTPLAKVKAVNLYHAAPPLANGQVSFNDDYTFSATLNFAGYNVSHFTPYCLAAGGVAFTCSEFAHDLSSFYITAAGMDATGAPHPPDFTGVKGPNGEQQDINCQPATDGGCDCGYMYQVAMTDKGVWNSGGSVLTENSAPDAYQLNSKSAGSQGPTSVMVSSFCQNGNELDLTGYNGSALFHVPGLHLLQLRKHTP